MQVSKKLEGMIEEQIRKEFESAYLYLSMSSQCEAFDFRGFAHWFLIQYLEEVDHALGLYRYLVDRGSHVELQAIAKPKYEWKTLLEVFEEGLAHERLVTKSINDIVEVAITEKDYATNIRLNWYVTEQIEEEMNFSNVIDTIKRLGGNNNGLYIMEQEMAKRVQAPPVP